MRPASGRAASLIWGVSRGPVAAAGRYTERQEYIAEHKALKEMELNKVQEQRRAAAAPAALPAPGAGLAHAGQVSLEHSAGAGQQARVAAGGAN